MPMRTQFPLLQCYQQSEGTPQVHMGLCGVARPAICVSVAWGALAHPPGSPELCGPIRVCEKNGKWPPFFGGAPKPDTMSPKIHALGGEVEGGCYGHICNAPSARSGGRHLVSNTLEPCGACGCLGYHCHLCGTAGCGCVLV